MHDTARRLLEYTDGLCGLVRLTRALAGTVNPRHTFSAQTLFHHHRKATDYKATSSSSSSSSSTSIDSYFDAKLSQDRTTQLQVSTGTVNGFSAAAVFDAIVADVPHALQALDPMISRVELLGKAGGGKSSIYHVAMELKRSSRSVSVARAARFDFCVCVRAYVLPHGCRVIVMRSVAEQHPLCRKRNVKLHGVRARMQTCGWYLRPRFAGGACFPEPQCTVSCIQHVKFPVQVSAWVLQHFCESSVAYIAGLTPFLQQQRKDEATKQK
jgi:hypothetical protein